VAAIMGRFAGATLRAFPSYPYFFVFGRDQLEFDTTITLMR